jgi:hypothetical protein
MTIQTLAHQDSRELAEITFGMPHDIINLEHEAELFAEHHAELDETLMNELSLEDLLSH